MYVLLGIVGELVTIMVTNMIIKHGYNNCFIKIYDKGFKYDFSLLDNFVENHKKSKKSKSINNILLLIPIYNIIYASIQMQKMNKEYFDSDEVQSVIVPLNSYEEAIYNRAKNKKEKLAFAKEITYNQNDQHEFISDANDLAKYLDFSCLHFCFVLEEPIFPLAYTYEEVKEFINAVGGDYIIGKAGSRIIAVIGITDPFFREVSWVQFANDETTYGIEFLSEQEAKDKTFLIYPFTASKDKEIANVVEEIKRKRNQESNNLGSNIVYSTEKNLLLERRKRNE